MKNKKTVGRERKYDSNFLIGLINKYSDEHPYRKIRIADLERKFDIKNYIWRDYTEVKEYIDKINSSSKVMSMPQENIAQISIDEFFEVNKGEEKLKRAVRGVFDTNRELYRLAVKAEQFIEKEKEYLKEIEELKSQNRLLNQTIKNQENEIDKLYLKSRSMKNRRELGLKNNLIELKANDSSVSKHIKDIEMRFPGLFDE